MIKQPDSIRRPLAFLVTISCRGHRLHGTVRGSVDKNHNTFGTPLVPTDAVREERMRTRMGSPRYVLDRSRRVILRAAIVALCAARNWNLRALHVRTTHFHCVLSADQVPGRILASLKSCGSRWLGRSGLDPAGTKRWARGGSCRYLWDEQQVAAAVDYVMHQQGDPMETYFKLE